MPILLVANSLSHFQNDAECAKWDAKPYLVLSQQVTYFILEVHQHFSVTFAMAFFCKTTNFEKFR